MRRVSLAIVVFMSFALVGFAAVGAPARLLADRAMPSSVGSSVAATSATRPLPPQEVSAPSAKQTAAVSLARGLIGDYFNLPDRGASLQLPIGDPAVRRVDQSIWFDWGRGAPSPRIGKDYFGVRWQGYLRAEAPGKYVFQISHVGLARLSLGGQVIFEQVARSAHRAALKEYTVTTPGWIPIAVESIQGAGASSIQLAWSPPGTSALVPIPNFVLAHRER